MFSKSTEKLCPLLKSPCIGDQCMFATTVRGTHPQTGEEIDQSGCAVAFLPVLLIENAKASHQTGAALESLRNATANNHDQLISLMCQNAGIIEAPNKPTKPS